MISIGLKNNKSKILLKLIIFILITYGCYQVSKYDEVKFDISGKTVFLASEIDAPGFFENNGIYYGYMYDLVRNYIDSRGAKLVVNLTSDDDALVEALNSDSMDIALSLILGDDYCEDNDILQSDITYEESYVVIAKSSTPRTSDHENLIDEMKGKRVAVTNAVRNTDFFKTYSNPDSLIDFQSNPNRLSREVARDLAFGKADYLICSKVPSRLLCYIFANFKTIHTLPSTNLSSLYFGEQNEDMRDDFTDWYNNEYLGSDSQLYSKELYSTQQYMQDFIHKGYLLRYNAFSPFDDIFKKIGKKTGIDWKLLCSIGEAETRFNKKLVSNVGAVGVMQVRPFIAKRYGFDVDSLSDIKYNIKVSAFIIDDIVKMLKYDKDSLTQDQILILSATYCAGIGRIGDAKRVARSMGENSKTWAGLKKGILALKVDSIYSNKKLVKYGKFSDGTAIRYAEKVAGKYAEIKLKHNNLTADSVLIGSPKKLNEI